MPHEKTRAIVLRANDYSESSQILALCTESSGQVHAIAKGSRRRAMKGVAVPDVLDYCEIVFISRPSPGLSILTEWQVVDGFRPLRRSLKALYALLYAVELVLRTTDRSEDDAAIFRCLLELERRCAAGDAPAASVMQFEMALLDALGLGPETGCCTQCGARLTGEVRFSPAAGGALCAACYVPGTDAVRTMAGTLASMTHVRRDAGDVRAMRLRMSAPVLREMRRLLDNYWLHTLQRPIRTRRYLDMDVPAGESAVKR